MMKWDGKGERPDGFRFEELDDTELARICEKRMEATTQTGDELRRVVIERLRDHSARLTCPPPKKDPIKAFVTVEVDTSKVDAAMKKVKELQALALETLDYMAALDAALTNFRAPAKNCKQG